MSTQCKYQPTRSLGEIPDGVVLNCKWISNKSSTYDKAYKLNGFWYLVWNDEAMKHPDAIQCRRIAIKETNAQITKDMLIIAADNELLLRQEIGDQREHIQMLEATIDKMIKEKSDAIAKLEAERDLWRAEAQRWRKQAIDLEGQIEAEIQRLQWRQHQLERGIKELKG